MDTKHPASFQAAVALEAKSGKQTDDELAKRFGIAVEQVVEWRQVLVDNAARLFAAGTSAGDSRKSGIDRQDLARTIAENSTQGFAMMDERGFCIYANRTWLDMTGYTEEEISSKPLHYLVHHHYPDGRPYPMEECPIDRALPENFEVRAHEDLFFRKDGSTFSVICAASPIFEGGRPVSTVIEIRDITENQRRDAELRKSQQQALDAAYRAESEQSRLTALLQAVPVSIGMADSNGALLAINEACKALWGADFTLPQSVSEYREFKAWWADGSERHGQQLKPEDWALARALQGEVVTNDIVEIEPFDKPQEHKIVQLCAAPARDGQGNIIGSVVAQVDLTTRVRAEEALKEADRKKDEFIAVLAHELRNPLAPIRTALDVFNQIGLSDPRLVKVKDAMGRQISQITRLVDDLLDVARISRGKIELRVERCDIVQIVRQTMEDYRASIVGGGAQLYLHAPVSSLCVEGDVARLTQIIGNLLHNAGKFTSAGDTISITVAKECFDSTDYAVIRVQDTGMGMRHELLSHLFSPFVQASQGLGRSGGGLGLGLALVKGLTELHMGTVSAQSEGLGLGSTFTVRIPICKPTSAVSNDRRNKGELQGLRIVAIDDNRDILETLTILLSLGGHEVTAASNGVDGLKAVREAKPDVVFCDIGLPGAMNGYDVVQAVRADNAIQSTFVVAMSGYGQASDRQKSFAMGFDQHLIKPITVEVLDTVLQQVRTSSNSSDQ